MNNDLSKSVAFFSYHIKIICYPIFTDQLMLADKSD